MTDRLTTALSLCSAPAPAHVQGTTVTISTKTNIRVEGVVLSTNAEGDTTGVTLKDVKEVTNPGAPLKETFFIAATNIQEWASGPADAKIPNGADSACFSCRLTSLPFPFPARYMVSGRLRLCPVLVS